MSVRMLVEEDRAALRDLALLQPETNLYLLGNLETLGFAYPFCTFWGDFGGDGALRGAANRYFTGWSVFGQAAAEWPALCALIDDDPDAERLQDNPGGVASILPFLRRYRAAQINVEELMRLDGANFAPQPAPAQWQIRRAEPSDVDWLAELYAGAGEMARSRAGIERPLRDGRIYVAEGPCGQIGAAALTNAETASHPALAMVGGVYTAPAYRGQGLSKALCSALCRALLAEDKAPILYWKEPAAGRVYRALGFRAMGSWRAVRLQRA